VIGIVGAVALSEPTEPPQPAMLIPLRQGPFRVASIGVRAHEASAALVPQLNKLMREIDADTPLSFHDYAAVVKGQVRTVRIVAGWFEVLGTVALMLAGAGLYGVMAVSVGRRTREIGVRRALGAPSRQILRDLFTRSIVQLVVGVAVGLAVGIPFARLLDDSLIATGYSSDPVVALSVVLVMILATVLAIIVPARRALRVDPITALRDV
jgi:ABC-type antimicrobial peptide transport system permease subunit